MVRSCATARFLWAILAFAAFIAPDLSGQSTLAILSPSAGTTVSLGQTLTVKYSADANVKNPLLVCDFDGCLSATPSAPGVFTVTIPTNSVIRSYTLNLLGVVDGQIFTAAPVTIQIDTPLTVASVTTSPKTLHFDEQGDALLLHVIGTLSDGSTADVTHSPQISYASSDANIISVDDQGTVTAKGAGTAFVKIMSAAGVYSVYAIVDTTQVATPDFSPAPGTYSAAQQVGISDATPGASVYYTLDGSVPTTASMPYSGPISISSTKTLQAIATATGYGPSAVASGTYTITLPADFSMNLNPSSLSIVGGQSGTASLTITSVKRLNAAVSFSCSDLPEGASCSFSPASVLASGGTVTTTVTVATKNRFRASIYRSASGIAFAMTLFFGFASRRRRTIPRLACGLWLLACLSGCGSGVVPVQSTVTVIATSGSLTHSLSLVLTVN